MQGLRNRSFGAFIAACAALPTLLGAACSKNGNGAPIAGDPAPTTSSATTTASATSASSTSASATIASTASMSPVAPTKTKMPTPSFDCPAKKPSDGASCAKLGVACSYPTYVAEGPSMDECLCSTTGEWHCHADKKAPINSK